MRISDWSSDVCSSDLSLPYGAQRRVEMARTLVASPELIILDEPAAGLNENESTALNDTIRSIRDMGVTVILVEQDMSVVMKVTDNIVVINFGKKIAEGGTRSGEHTSELQSLMRT